MKTLLALRHAKSSWKDHALHDHDRPLNRRGQRDAPRLGRLLRDEDLVPDLIVSSSAERARRTAEIVADASGYAGEIVLEPALYGAGPRDVLDVAAAVPDAARRLLVVGHNPTLELLVELTTGRDEVLPTAALAWIEAPVDRWDEIALDGSARLMRVWRPKEMWGKR